MPSRGEPATTLKVGSIEPRSRDFNVAVKVSSKGEVRETTSRRDGTTHYVAEALVGDETGCVYLTLWDDNIAKVNEGESIVIKNGYVSLFRGSMRLNVGRYGSLEPSSTAIAEVNTANNLSEKRYGEERAPSFRPFYRERGGYGRGRGGYRPRRR